MPVQPMLPELEPRRHTAPPAPLRSPTHGVSAPAPVWLQRLSLVVFVLFCFYIGGLLAVLPWSQSYWEHNGWLLAHPALNSIVQRGWVRGVISGIGPDGPLDRRQRAAPLSRLPPHCRALKSCPARHSDATARQ